WAPYKTSLSLIRKLEKEEATQWVAFLRLNIKIIIVFQWVLRILFFVIFLPFLSRSRKTK
ncbi:hypothetical protein ABN222_02780, partial [Providencia alcalifaciens]